MLLQIYGLVREPDTASLHIYGSVCVHFVFSLRSKGTTPSGGGWCPGNIYSYLSYWWCVVLANNDAAASRAITSTIYISHTQTQTQPDQQYKVTDTRYTYWDILTQHEN